ncbi:MAG: hypothetical protein KF857_11475 [Fimbriimonadaceae bacterium]|nr:hypothetical protein [Fimbriimonadaceae bacterium]
MKTIYWSLVVMFLACGLYRIFGLQIQNFKMKDEAWLLSIVPSQVEDYNVVPSEFSPKASYRMDAKTYTALKPIGIAGQTYRGPRGTMDAVVIAGDRMESFHDQRWCFAGQGWEVTDEKKQTLDVPGYGKVPMWTMKLRRGNEEPRLAAFTFKTPVGFRTEYQKGQIDYLVSEFKTGHPNVGFSFRFIEMDTSMSEKDFYDFVKAYFVTSKQTSKNVL